MNDKLKYDPEDIESLLRHKSFDELYPEERSFVLKHIESKEEYESMRMLVSEITQNETTADRIKPDPQIKKALLEEFTSENKGGITVWLNSLFASGDENRPVFKRPGFQLATVGLAAAITLLVVFRTEEPEAIAENRKIENTSESESEREIDREMAAIEDEEGLESERETVRKTESELATPFDEIEHIEESEISLRADIEETDLVIELAEDVEFDANEAIVLEQDDMVAEEAHATTYDKRVQLDEEVADGDVLLNTDEGTPALNAAPAAKEEEIEQGKEESQTINVQAYSTETMAEDVSFYFDTSNRDLIAIDNAIGNQVETVQLASVEVAEVKSINKGFSKPTYQKASAKDYKHLLDDLYTAR